MCWTSGRNRLGGSTRERMQARKGLRHGGGRLRTGRHSRVHALQARWRRKTPQTPKEPVSISRRRKVAAPATVGQRRPGPQPDRPVIPAPRFALRGVLRGPMRFQAPLKKGPEPAPVRSQAHGPVRLRPAPPFPPETERRHTMKDELLRAVMGLLALAATCAVAYATTQLAKGGLSPWR